jgi:hypothetical protein
MVCRELPSRRLVRKLPGSTMVTFIPSGDSSACIASLRPFTANFVALKEPPAGDRREPAHGGDVDDVPGARRGLGGSCLLHRTEQAPPGIADQNVDGAVATAIPLRARIYRQVKQASTLLAEERPGPPRAGSVSILNTGVELRLESSQRSREAVEHDLDESPGPFFG